MRRWAWSLLAAAAIGVVLGGVALAQTAPQFKLGFETLAKLIPETVGTPVEEEHYAANGDSLQQTSTGLMVWRKADNWTAFTNGYRTWINGPLGLQQRLNTELFDWEVAAPTPPATPSATAVSAPTSLPTPTTQPSPTALPKAALRASAPNVIQGQGLMANTVWAMGEIRNDSTLPAYNMVATARLLSPAGAVLGTASQAFAYLGPGDTVGYRIELRNVSGYATADVSLDSLAGGFARFGKGSIEWVKNQRLEGTTSTGSRYEFTGILHGAGPSPVALNGVYVWFLDAQGRVVWMDTSYVTNALGPEDSFTFVIRTPWPRDNPQIAAVQEVRYYTAGQLQ